MPRPMKPILIFLVAIIAIVLIHSVSESIAVNKVEGPNLESLIGTEVKPDSSPHPTLLVIQKADKLLPIGSKVYADVIILLPEGSSNAVTSRPQIYNTGQFSTCGFYIQFEVGNEGQTWTFEECLKYQGSNVTIREIRYRYP